MRSRQKGHQGPRPSIDLGRALPTKNSTFGLSHFREALEAACDQTQRRLEHEAQHGQRVHILMENHVPCDNKWVDLPGA